MRCSQAEQLLSMNLDGRLAAGQRRDLSEHLAACGRCQTTERDLRAARELALGLPVQRLRDGFREELWARIRAGEGTPEAVFREEVPTAAKLRYFATGAAAAGLLILAAHWFRPRGEVSPQAASQTGLVANNNGREVAPNAVKPAGKLVPRAQLAHAPVELTEGMQLATPDKLATLVADGYGQAVRTLHEKVSGLEAQPAQPSTQWVESLRAQVNRARGFAEVLEWLAEGKYIRLTEDEVVSLKTIEVLSEQVRGFDDPEGLRRVLRPLRTLRVDAPLSFFCNPCVQDETTFYTEFLKRLHSSELDSAMPVQIQIVEEHSPAAGGARQMKVIVQRR